MNVLHMDLGADSYDIVIERGALQKADEYLNLDRKVLVVTDDGVPKQYARTVAAMAKDGVIVTVPQGEDSKSIAQFSAILSRMLKEGFSRRDAVVAVGGGVVGGGFLHRRQNGGESGWDQEYRRRVLSAEEGAGRS